MNTQEAGDAPRWDHKGLPALEEIMKSKGEIRVESGISYETPVS